MKNKVYWLICRANKKLPPPTTLIVGDKKNFIIIAEKTFFHKNQKIKATKYYCLVRTCKCYCKAKSRSQASLKAYLHM